MLVNEDGSFDDSQDDILQFNILDQLNNLKTKDENNSGIGNISNEDIIHTTGDMEVLLTLML